MTDVAHYQERLIVALSHRASLCSRIFDAWSSVGPTVPVGPRELTGAAHLSHSDEVGTAELLRTLHSLGMLEGPGPRWTPTPSLAASMATLAVIFRGIDIYRSRVQKNATDVKIIATRPGSAVTLDKELAASGWQTPHPEETDESMADLIAGAARTIVVMTPFLDARGSVILKTLLDRAHDDAQVTIILRNLGRPERKDYPVGFPLILDWLRKRRVAVFDYSLQNSPVAPIETFHAKLLIADGVRAYVGSANMTGASFESSMEMGVILSGEAARQLSRFVEVVVRCAKPCVL
jgi:phosphatidylserine/phosphatidylglycerophosphate/cardiolipin synthase-like enzyme